MAGKKSPRAKLQGAAKSEVVTLDGANAVRMKCTQLLIPAGDQVESLIRQIPGGKVVTSDVFRTALAARHGGETACPLVTGIFLRLVGEATEAERDTEPSPAPYWRVIRADGSLNPKYPGGTEHHQSLLESDGIPLVKTARGGVRVDPAVLLNTL